MPYDASGNELFFGEDVAAGYDEGAADMFRPEVVEPVVDLLAELDLMARIAGMRLESRWSNWQREAFTAVSRSHVSVWAKRADS